MKFNETEYSITTLRKRVLATIIAITFIFIFIIIKMFFVQVVGGKKLQTKAIDQWTRELPVKAERGKITDCNGEILVTSKGTYGVYVRTRSVKNKEFIAEILSQELGVDEKELLTKLNKNVSEITVKTQIEKEKIEKLKSLNLDGVYFSIDSQREYPYNELLCQILGYTSSDGTGITGIEAYYDKYLKGTDGDIVYESDLVGVDIEGKKAKFIPAIDGLNVGLTIDLEIQKICESVASQAYERYTPKGVSIIVMDCNSGGIKGISTYPSYDLNEVPRDNLEYLNKSSRSSLIVDSYEPGSTFKIITSTANIEEYYKGNGKAYSLTHIFSSNRYRVVDGRKIKCWSTHNNGKHANENLALALNNSCNPVFVDIALSLGKETMYKYIQGLGFGKVTGIDYYGEAQGMLLPMSSITSGDLARIGFGQTIAVTPLQLITAVNACVNGGNKYTPYFAERIYDEYGNDLERITPKCESGIISEKTSRTIASYLEGVVSSGSGKQCYIEGYKVGGKTGTAQKYENGIIAQGKYIMSFIGFFPSDNPRYIALVVVDEPVGGQYGSTVAAPLCKEVFEKIINVKKITSYNEL